MECGTRMRALYVVIMVVEVSEAMMEGLMEENVLMKEFVWLGVVVM